MRVDHEFESTTHFAAWDGLCDLPLEHARQHTVVGGFHQSTRPSLCVFMSCRVETAFHGKECKRPPLLMEKGDTQRVFICGLGPKHLTKGTLHC